MATFGKVGSATAAIVGATADSFDEVGVVKIPKFATHIHGFLISYAENIRIAAEATQAQCRWNAPDFNMGNQIFNLPIGSGGGPATNVAAIGRKQFLKAVDLPVDGQGDVIFEWSSHVPDPTNGWDVAISVLFNDGLSERFQRFWPFPIASLGSDAEAAAAVTATTEAAITDLDIQSWAEDIVSLDFGIAPDAAQTAGDPVVPIFILRSSFKGFDPQEYVGPSITPMLGTAVGDGLVIEGIGIPVEIPVRTSARETVTPNVKFTTTSANDVAVRAGCSWTDGRRQSS